MTYPDSLAWLYGERYRGIKPGLQRTLAMLDALGTPHQRLRTIHVAGTNGKGSVCAMLDAICRAAGLRTGFYCSPHLVTFRERIRVDGTLISESDVAAGVDRIREITRGWDAVPTFFEIVTVLALDHFARSDTEIAILETGMGGRLDSTNVTIPLASVITRIDLDHQQWLGPTLAEIAREKAGIIKPGVPLLTVPQEPAARAVLIEWASQAGAPLTEVTRANPELPCALAGSHQKLHATLAAETIRVAGLHATDDAIASGLANTRWPARFDCLADDLVIDGAHNPAAAQRLTLTWREVFGERKATILLAVLQDKDAAGIAAALAPIAARFVVTRVRNGRTLEADELLEIVRTIAPHTDVAAEHDPLRALELARRYDHPILATGSLFLAGELLAGLGQITPDPAV